MDVRVPHKALFASQTEERAVRDAGLFGIWTWVRAPGVQVSIEVDDGDRPVDFVQCAEDGQHDRVVAS